MLRQFSEHPAVRRFRALVRRYRVDGRLPPGVSGLLREEVELRVHDSASSVSARARSSVGSVGSGRSDDLVIVESAGRRFAVARVHGGNHASTHELALSNADFTFGALAAHGVDAFLVDQDGDRCIAGVLATDRSLAWSAVCGAVREPGWFVGWRRGSRTGFEYLEPFGGGATSDVVMPNAFRRASSWFVFRGCALGGDEIGVHSATEVAFWEMGTSGMHERVGVRGQERFDVRSPRTIEAIAGHEYPGREAFPVARAIGRFIEPIDVVYTWVDGADPAWQAEFALWAGREGRTLDEASIAPGRYRSRDELRYSLRSLALYAGWVRRVYVVTSGQRPDWLVEDERLRVVSHAEILPADSVPTFNSHAIESALHRIDGLAEHFVYLNDDVFIGRPVRPEQFFTANGLFSVYASDARVHAYDDGTARSVDTAARNTRELLQADFGRTVTHKPLHAPFPMRRSVLAEIERRYPDIVRATGASRFRHPSDYSIPSSLAQFFGVLTGQAVFGSLDVEYANLESGRLGLHLDRLARSRRFDAFCLNETELSSGDPDHVDCVVSKFLSEYFPLRSPWETAHG